MKRKIKKTVAIITVLTLIFQILIPIVPDLNMEVLAVDETIADLEISTKEELIAFANDVNNGNTYKDEIVVLTADIDLEGNENNQWTPIGSSDNNFYGFEGIFDGQNHTISNVYICNSNNISKGFFGRNKGTIKNLNISSGTVIGNEYNSSGVGGLVGSNDGIIENVKTTLDIYNDYTDRTGGVAAFNTGHILKCINKSNIIVNNDDFFVYVGGIVGYNCGIVKECVNEARIEHELCSGGVGGIAGLNTDNVLSNNGTIVSCINKGNVKGERYAGGITGDNRSGIRDSLNYGEIEVRTICWRRNKWSKYNYTR